MKKLSMMIGSIAILTACTVVQVAPPSNSPQPPTQMTAPTTATANTTDEISFARNILPIMSNNCTSCHAKFNNYEHVQGSASKILAAIQSGYMPKNAEKLSPDLIAQVEKWITQGKKNN